MIPQIKESPKFAIWRAIQNGDDQLETVLDVDLKPLITYEQAYTRWLAFEDRTKLYIQKLK